MQHKSDKRRLNTRSNYGFTLIELLVVISILSLVIAILLPVLNKARRVSKRLKCQSNLRQIASAWGMYLDDNDGKFYQRINANTLYGGWKGIYFPNHRRPLNEYLRLDDLPQSEKDARIFFCPCDNDGTGKPVYSSVGTSYQTNILLIGQDQIGMLPSDILKDAINAKLKNLNISQVANPSNTLLIGDYAWQTQWLPSPYPFGMPWHSRCCHFNMAFLDSHIEFIKIHKGIFYTEEYRVIPFKDLYGLAVQEQVKEPCPKCD